MPAGPSSSRPAKPRLLIAHTRRLGMLCPPFSSTGKLNFSSGHHHPENTQPKRSAAPNCPQTHPPNPSLLRPQLHLTAKAAAKKGVTNLACASSSSSPSAWGTRSPCLHPPPPSAPLARGCPAVLPLCLSRAHGRGSTGMLVPLLRWAERRCQYPREPGGTPCPRSPCA